MLRRGGLAQRLVGTLMVELCAEAVEAALLGLEICRRRLAV